MAYNYNLDRAIREAGITKRDFAKIVPLHESVISKILHGKYNITDLQKIRFARILKKKVEDLFD